MIENLFFIVPKNGQVICNLEKVYILKQHNPLKLWKHDSNQVLYEIFLHFLHILV